MSAASDKIFLCSEGDLQEGKPQKFVLDGTDVMLLKLSGEIYAFEPMCSHDGTDISRGKLDTSSGTLECPKHYAVFDVRSGTPLRGPFGADGDTQPPLRLYRITFDSGRIMLEANQEWGPIIQAR
jgi:3-phenylpropionate/trans-cinnamate dioxygenase ferredoxin subunit